jgi:ATP-binding cassette, subfamily B, bacterial PglK
MQIYQKLKQLLTKPEQWRMLLLLFMMFIGMLLETLGLGLVIASMTMMTQPDLAQKYPIVEPLLRLCNYPNQIQLIAGGMLSLLVIYFFKTAFLALMNWKRNKFIYDVQANLSNRLFQGYIEQPWAFHLQRNSAQLIQNIMHEVVIFCSSTLNSGMVLLTDGLVFLGVSIMIVCVEPIGGCITLGVLAVVVLTFQRFFRSRVSRWGKLRQYHEENRLQHLQQGLGGAKDLKLLGREHNFVEQFSKHNIKSGNVNHKLSTLLEVPRLLLELLAVIGLVCMVLVMLVQGKPVGMLIPTLGLFAAAAFRLMPSVSRILGSMQNLRYSSPSIHVLYDEMMLIAGNKISKKQGKITFSHDIVLENIAYKYANAKQDALRNISLSIPRGTSVGFIGTSGAGKSTLVDIILGLLTPGSGTIYVDNKNIQMQLRGWQDQIGYVPQAIFLTDDTLKRNVAFGLPDNQIDDASVSRAIKAAHLDEFIDSLPEGMETTVGERGVRLSGGQRQRIGIARALYHDPEILVFDEATSSLDSMIENEVMNDINALQGKKTLIIVAHRLSTLKNCNCVYRLEQGKIVDSGSFTDVINREEITHEFSVA